MNIEIRNIIKKEKEKWIKKQCVIIENNLENNNNKMAYQNVKELTNTKQRRVSVMQDKAGKCLTKEHEVLTRFTEYCSHQVYDHHPTGSGSVVVCTPAYHAADRGSNPARTRGDY